MKKLLETIVAELVEDKDAVEVTVDEPNEKGVVVYHLHVASSDMGRVIGKQGRIAKAIRTVMRAGASRIDQKIMVEIEE
ncbi:MAG: KH domain-containing protein [Ruminococcus sp.]|nr:KH domain-containing protein [Ruminococcus sp.]